MLFPKVALMAVVFLDCIAFSPFECRFSEYSLAHVQSREWVPIYRASRLMIPSPRLSLIVALALGMICGPVIDANGALAQSLPQGGRVAAGTATIGAPSNGSLTVQQSSNRAVINWQSFSIGQGNTVNFVEFVVFGSNAEPRHRIGNFRYCRPDQLQRPGLFGQSERHRNHPDRHREHGRLRGLDAGHIGHRFHGRQLQLHRQRPVGRCDQPRPHQGEGRRIRRADRRTCGKGRLHHGQWRPRRPCVRRAGFGRHERQRVFDRFSAYI